MIKKFNEYFEESFLSKLGLAGGVYRIKYLCNEYNIDNYIINDDGTVDVDGNVKMFKYNDGHNGTLTNIPLKFNRVEGNFNCGWNELITLEGSPNYVGGNFDCEGNEDLETLEGSPSYVGGDFKCGRNNLYTLNGCPKEIIGKISYKSDHWSKDDNVPISEILQAFRLSANSLKELFSVWNNFTPVYKIGKEWHVDNIRLMDLYY